MASKPSRLLERQKPVRGRRHVGHWLRWTACGAGLVVFALIATVVIVNSMPRHTPQIAKIVPVNSEAPALSGWRVRVLPESVAQLNDEVLRDIATMITQQIRTGSRAELDILGRQILRTHLLDRVHLVHTGTRDIIVQLVPRTAVMRVEADRLRWLTADGKIYGEAPIPAMQSIDQPLLKGLFDRAGRRHVMNDDQTLRISDDESIELHEAIELLAKSREALLSVKEIEFVAYRGFSITLADKETVATVGRSPFDGTLKHLVSVLRTLEKRGSQAARIELDYSGKAFVKERKL